MLKYNNKPKIGYLLGKLLAFNFEKYDQNTILLPVPLHKNRQKERGYNQSEKIAEGIAAVTGLPVVTDAVIRTFANTTQTHKTSAERLVSTYDIFKVCKNLPYNTHIILVDDVFTTGSTLESLALCMLENNPTFTFSIAVLIYRNKIEM